MRSRLSLGLSIQQDWIVKSQPARHYATQRNILIFENQTLLKPADKLVNMIIVNIIVNNVPYFAPNELQCGLISDYHRNDLLKKCTKYILRELFDIHKSYSLERNSF